MLLYKYMCIDKMNVRKIDKEVIENKFYDGSVLLVTKTKICNQKTFFIKIMCCDYDYDDDKTVNQRGRVNPYF